MKINANNLTKSLINSILSDETFAKLNKTRKNFIVNALWHILAIKGKINFLQFGRFANASEQTYRNQFSKKFDFFGFNKILINKVLSHELVIAFDPCFIPKAGKRTYGRGKYWSGVAKTAKWGLDICGFAAIDPTKKTALHLNAWQTPSPDILKEKELSLQAYYAEIVVENAQKFKEFSKIIVADAYFSKKPVVDKITSAGFDFISRLREDSDLKYKYLGPKTGKKGAPRKFTGRIDFKNLDLSYFSTSTHSPEMIIHGAIVYSKAFKRDIKLAVAIFFKEGKEISRKLYFSTDTKLCAEKLVGYYRSRFQIEFLYRDAKQFTGLTNCQARDQNKLDFHFNASLTAVNLARFDWLSTYAGEGKPFSMSDYKTHAHNTLLLERFIGKFAINPNLAKNQKIINELLDYGKIAA